MIKISRKKEVEKLLNRKRELDLIVQISADLKAYSEVLVIDLNDMIHKQNTLTHRLNAQIKAVSRKISREKALANKSSKSGLNKKDYHLNQVNYFESECVDLKKKLHAPNDKIDDIQERISRIVNEINWYYNETRLLSRQVQLDYEKIASSVKK